MSIRTTYQKLYSYNFKPQGTVQGPIILSQSIPLMKRQTPLYPKVNKGYNSLIFDGNDQQYYKINNGPYAQPCSENKNRLCSHDISTYKLYERNVGSPRLSTQELISSPNFTKFNVQTSEHYSPHIAQSKTQMQRDRLDEKKLKSKSSSRMNLYYSYPASPPWPKLHWSTTKDASKFIVEACGGKNQPPCKASPYAAPPWKPPNNPWSCS